jgi:hypothetical protein
MDREIFAPTVLPPVPVIWEAGMSPRQGCTNSGCQIAVKNKLCAVASCMGVAILVRTILK